MDNFLEITFPPALDRRIERLHRQAIELRQALARPTTGRRRDREKVEYLQKKLELNRRLIAEYSELGSRMAIEGELPEYRERSKQLEQLEKQGEKRELAIDGDKIRWFRRRLKKWFSENRRDFPWRHERNPYEIFIAEIFLTRTRSENVVPVYNSFLQKYPTVETLVEAPLQEVARAMAPLGLDFRAGQLHRSAERLVTLYDGIIPDTEKELLTLPGVGRYTANAVLATAFDRRAIVVDTNVVRILERFFGLEGRSEKSRDNYLWDAAGAIAPKQNLKEWNWALIDFGAMVCTPNPRCLICPLQKHCDFFLKG